MYRSKLSPLYLPDEQSVVVDLWIGSSEVLGIGATQATMLVPTSAEAPTPLTVSRIWDRWLSTEALRGAEDPDSYDWELTPLDSSTSGTNTTFAYAQGYYYQTRKPLKVHSGIDLDVTPYHHTVLLGASTSALNDDITTLSTKLAHWSPLVTGTGELVAWNAGAGANTGAGESADMGLCEHYITNYLIPALSNLQAAGKNVYVGGLYVSISGDSLSGYTAAEAMSWGTNFGMLRRAIEAALGFVGIPTMILGVSSARYSGSPTASSTISADTQDEVRESQQAYVAANHPTTRYFSTLEFPTVDQVHFDGQSCMDIAAEVTAARYASQMGLAHITKAL